MKDKTVAARYAQALFDLGREQEEKQNRPELCELYLAQLGLICDTIRSHYQAKTVFSGLLLPVEAKQDMARRLFEELVEPEVLHFLLLLLEKERQDYLEAIYEALRELVDARNGVLEVAVRTAQELTAEQQQALTTALRQITGQQARLEITIEPELIGGMIMTIGDTVYDGSVAGQLRKLQEQLSR